MVPIEKSLKDISIIIPTWNGKDLLQKFLPSVIKAANFYKGNAEIIIVDDGSTDASAEFLRTTYPIVKTISLKNNHGFAVACNSGLKHARHELVVFLNNDMEVAEDFLLPLSKHFDDEEIFGVRLGIKWLTQEGMATDISNLFLSLTFRFGFIECPMLRLKQPIEPFYCAYVSGGAGIFDREKLLQLQGFDQMFTPFYWEDVDLSYRAWKRGWKTVYESSSMVYHQPHSTTSRFKKRNYVWRISRRNRYLLIWKNISDSSLIIKHMFFIPCQLLVSLVSGNLNHFFALFEALKHLPAVIKKRRFEKHNRLVDDKDIFLLFDQIASQTEPFFEKNKASYSLI